MTDRTAGAPGRWTPLLAVGLILLLVLLPVWLFVTVSESLADVRAYAAAPACPDDGTRSDTCRARVPATVEGTETSSVAKNTRHRLLLAEQGSDTVLRVSMDGRKPVYGAVRTGDEVTLVYWRGKVRAVEFGAVTQETEASPVGDWKFPLGLGLLTLPFGVNGLWTVVWLRFRHRCSSAAPPRLWGLAALWATGVTVGGVGFVAGTMADSVPDALMVTAAGVPPAAVLSCLGVWWLRRRAEKAEDTSGIVAVPVTGRWCLRATVRGDVLYGVDGYLVVGDGFPPAVTSDPAGFTDRRELPGTLAVERVRAFRPGDPQEWRPVYEYDGVVIECRDGGRTVLIATRRRDAPFILGALTGASTGRTAPGAGQTPGR
ncbi:MAG TPA: hypothetical protein VFY14_09185 [Streptomyces sp.]|nr:hypothetical protein [Streptomyces sp.]